MLRPSIPTIGRGGASLSGQTLGVLTNCELAFVSQGVARGTLGLTVNRSASVSMGQPVTMSAGPVPARPAGGEASVNMVSWVQAGA